MPEFDAEKEINNFKNLYSEIKKKNENTGSVASNNHNDLKIIKKEMADLKSKMKNISIGISEIKTEVNTQADNGGIGGGGSSFNEEELKALVIANIPYDNIGIFVKKLLKESSSKDGDKKVDIKKNGGSKAKLYFLIFLILAAVSYGSFTIFNQNKIQTGIMSKGTEYYDFQKKQTYKLLKDKKVSGRLEIVNTKDGMIKYFISSEIKDGKELKYKFVIK